jgi:DNA-binding transcriptional LysR family regulator
MIDWDLWHTLLTVLRHGSFRDAGRVLGIDPTTVGRKVKNLERQIGQGLVVRRDGRLYPTAKCEDVLPSIEAAEEALRGIGDGKDNETDNQAIWRELTITAPPFLISCFLGPEIGELTKLVRANVQLMGTSDRQLLSRREADMALRIEDQPGDEFADSDQIGAIKLGLLTYRVYCQVAEQPGGMPWTGLLEGHRRTTGINVQSELTGQKGTRYRLQQFEALQEVVASGSAKAMLPDIVVRDDQRLHSISDIVLEQPLWLFYHRQDEETGYLSTARRWIEDLALLNAGIKWLNASLQAA